MKKWLNNSTSHVIWIYLYQFQTIKSDNYNNKIFKVKKNDQDLLNYFKIFIDKNYYICDKYWLKNYLISRTNCIISTNLWRILCYLLKNAINYVVF